MITFPLAFPYDRAICEPQRPLDTTGFVVGAMLTRSHAHFGARLAASCRAHAIPLALFEVPCVHRSISAAGVEDLRYTKANFVHFLLERYGCPVLYLDADCEIVQKPLFMQELLDTQVDFSIFNWFAVEHTEAYVPAAINTADVQRTGANRFYRFSHSVEVMSDTQLFCSGAVQWYNHTDAARHLLETWHGVIARAPGRADDKCLDLAFNNYPSDAPRLKASWLDKRHARYAWWIYERPVIDHPEFPSSGEGFTQLDTVDGMPRFHRAELRQAGVVPVFPKDCLIDSDTRTLLRLVEGTWRAVGPVSVPLWLRRHDNDARGGESSHDVSMEMAKAKAFHTAGRLDDAKQAYATVLDLDPTNFDAIHHLGILALQRGSPAEAIPRLLRAVELQPGNAHARANLGTAYLQSNLLENALEAYDGALDLAPRLAGGWRNRGTILQRLGRHPEAADAFQRCRDLAPGFDFALGSMFESRRYACDWHDYQRYSDEVLAGVSAGSNADRPFSFLSVSGSADHQLRCATRHAAYICPRPVPSEWRGEKYRHDKIRVAYVSADFRAHVVMKLLVPLLEAHDRRHFELIGVSLGGEDDSEILRRAKRALDQHVSVSHMSDLEAAGVVRRLEADIAVDLTGYTAGCRPGIFARRPAPVQVSYLGYIGTSGTSFMDYLIADRVSVPPTAENFYSERIVRMPRSFLPPDDSEPIAARVPPRSELGLPEEAFVFCAFSNSYKFNPTTFDSWMRFLREVPGSVLWLRDGGAAMRTNLARESHARGVDPRRLVFAPKVAAMQDHLARHRQADLFLDTWPFAGHATARDALWAGLPVLTLVDESFASRVAASLLTCLNLPELITDHRAEYEECALSLARDRNKLAALRSRLSQSLRAEKVFDTALYCRHLEYAYTMMWRRSEQGIGPVSFDVPIEGAISTGHQLPHFDR